MRSSVKIVLTVLCTLAVAFVLLMLVVAHYAVAFILDTETEGELLPVELAANDPATGRPSPRLEWMVGASQERSLLSEDGLTLHGYYIEASPPSDRYAILCHGYKNSALSMADYAWVYHHAGWNVLVPDHRSHGYSQGRYIGMGWNEHRDLVGWVNQLVSQDRQARIVLHGLSMGAATVMMATGSSSLPPNVVAAVEDCGYSSVLEEFADKVSRVMGLPSFPLVPITSFVTRLKAGYFLGDVDCASAVSRSVTPTLFIHGDQDTFVPFWMLEEVYDAAACPKAKLVVPGAAHAMARTTDPELYWSTVGYFVERFAPEG